MKIKDWVRCPICNEPGMRREVDVDENALITCVNHACASNNIAATDVKQEPPALATMHASDFRSALHFTNLFGSLKLPVKVQCGHACFTITKENQDAVALGVLMAAEWNDCEPEPPEPQPSAVGKYSNTPHKTIEQILSDATARTAAGEDMWDVVNDLVDGYCLGHGSANALAVQEAAGRGLQAKATPAQRQCPRCGSPCREGTRGRWDLTKQLSCTVCVWSDLDG